MYGRARVFVIIISKFGHWFEATLIVLLEIDKSLEVSLYDIILSFCLAVSLQIKGGEKLTVDAKEVIK